ncbi:MAG TPA: TlpA disulfide reductase family protein [Planctomycetota bacterium]|nr:TlpA disulfide reductase family protein [Planctomycetota bacterium]
MASVLSLLAQAPPGAEDAAWSAAMSLKQRSELREAAAAFEKFRADFPQSSHALGSVVEEGVCWFSEGRSLLSLHRTTPEAQAKFDKALALFQSVTRDHPTAPEASRAGHMQGSTHFFASQLELAEADFSAVLDKFAADKNYVGKALLQRATVRRQLLRTQDALADLRRWLKEFGAPQELLAKTNSELARAQMLDKPAPAWKAETWFNGEAAPLESQAGNLVALFFFATWCSNCAEERPYVLDLERRFGPRGVCFIGVTDHQEGQTPEMIRAHLAEQRIPFRVFQDDHATSNAYKIDGIPMIALIDRKGILRWCDKVTILSDVTLEKLLAEGQETGKK